MSSLGIPTAALDMRQSQAQWDAIVAIKANSPFAASRGTGGSGASSESVAGTLDAMLGAYDPAAAVGGASLEQVGERVRAAQQSTIDLFA